MHICEYSGKNFIICLVAVEVNIKSCWNSVGQQIYRFKITDIYLQAQRSLHSLTRRKPSFFRLHSGSVWLKDGTIMGSSQLSLSMSDTNQVQSSAAPSQLGTCYKTTMLQSRQWLGKSIQVRSLEHAGSRSVIYQVVKPLSG